MTAETAFHNNFAGHGRYLIGKCRQRVHHIVDGLSQRRDLALGVHREFLGKSAIRNSSHDLDDTAHLFGNGEIEWPSR